MTASFIRMFKRLFLLLPGLIIGYYAYSGILPVLNKGLPRTVAIFVTYIVTAYLLIPLALRIIRRFIKPKHIPLYSLTPDGFACDPINIAMVGTEDQVKKAMEAAGWYLADQKDIYSVFHLIVRTMLKRPYLHAPFSNLYLLGRSQDLGFQQPVGRDPRHRHHVRFWAASHTGDPRHLDHISFWERIHKSDLVQQRLLWIGAASLDTGLGIIRHNAQLTHMISPDTDSERELITNQLKRTGHVTSTNSVRINDPYRLTNRVWTGYLKTDGYIKLIILKNS